MPVYYYFINISYIVNYYYTRVFKKWVHIFYSKEGSERGLKIGKIIKAQQPEVYKQLKKERKENLSSNYIEKLMENNKGVDEKKCR